MKNLVIFFLTLSLPIRLCLGESQFVSLIGGSTIDDNGDYYLDLSKLMYKNAYSRSYYPSMSLAAGNKKIKHEGVEINYELNSKALYEGGYLTPTEKKFVSFNKDLNGDGKSNIQFSGTRSGMINNIKSSISNLKDGDTLNIFIGDHGGYANSEDIFDPNNSITVFIEKKMEDLFTRKETSEDTNITPLSYKELKGLINAELKQQKLFGKVKIRLDSHTCHSGGIIGLTDKNYCATASNIGTLLTTGVPHPNKYSTPSNHLIDLRDFLNGYWGNYHKYLIENK